MEPWKCMKSVMLAISVLIVSSMCAGCVGRYTGGGHIDSAAGAPAKATFGFVIDASEPDANGFPTQVRGQFQYVDHGAGVQFHAEQLTPAGYARVFPDIFNPQAVMIGWTGTYTCPAGTGTVELGASSHTQVGPMGEVNQDAVFVSVLSGPYAGYENAGLIGGGTIRFRSR